MTFAEKLRQLRQTAGLSESGLAARSGVSFGAIHNYGLGLRKPTFRAVLKIARALGVSCEAFAACEDVGAEAGDGRPAHRPPGRPRRAVRARGGGAPPRSRTRKGT